MTRRTLTVNRTPSPSRRSRFSPPTCESRRPETGQRCILDTGHDGRPHFADGAQWDDEEAAA